MRVVRKALMMLVVVLAFLVVGVVALSGRGKRRRRAPNRKIWKIRVVSGVPEEITELALHAFSVWRKAVDEVSNIVTNPGVPILYFGDLEAYLASARRILTVGLNPSHEEFPSSEPFRRFPLVAHLETNKLGSSDIGSYVCALNEYFRRNPYRSWFGTFEPLLQGVGASYYLGTGSRSVSLHTDLCSPVATDPTWRGLTPSQRGKLMAHGRPLWHALVRALRPDVLVVSVAQQHLANIEFERVGEKSEIFRIERSRPYSVVAQWLRLTPNNQALLVFGRAAQRPFGTVSAEDRRRIGRRIEEILSG